MNIVGHTKQRAILERIRTSHAIPHTLLFSGPEHVGKELVARAFIHNLFASEDDWQALGGESRLAMRLNAGVHPDVLVVGAEEGIDIVQARKLRQFTQLSAFEGSWKCVIIDNAHTLGRLGGNTLLKTLEEPPPDTLIILVTHRPELLPDTIRSRAMHIAFSLVSEQEIHTLVPSKKRSGITKEIGWIAGRPGLLTRYLQDKNAPAVKARRAYFHAFEKTFKDTGIAVRLALAEKMAKEEHPHLALEGLLLAARTLLVARPNTHLVKRMTYLHQAKEYIQFTNVNTRLALEHAFIAH